MTKEERVQHLAKIICNTIEAQSYCKGCYNFDKCKPAEAVYDLIKQTEQKTAEKIFADLYEELEIDTRWVRPNKEFISSVLAQLKKKYGVQ